MSTGHLLPKSAGGLVIYFYLSQPLLGPKQLFVDLVWMSPDCSGLWITALHHQLRPQGQLLEQVPTSCHTL